ncbi:hypothetical protein ABVT39_011554 [Epinephelus coioides]
MAQGYNWDSVTPIPWSSSSDSSSGDSDTSSLLGDTMEDIPWASLLEPLPRPVSPLREPVPPCGCDPEVSPSDPPPAPGKPVEAGPSKGPVAPGEPKSLPKGPKPRWVQNLFRMRKQVGSYWQKRTEEPDAKSSGISKCCVKEHPAINRNLTCQNAELHPPEQAFLLPTGLSSWSCGSGWCITLWDIW